MKLVWDESAWADYAWWQAQDRKILQRINTLITDIQRNGNDGIGKPGDVDGDPGERAPGSERTGCLRLRAASASGLPAAGRLVRFLATLAGQAMWSAKGAGRCVVVSDIEPHDLGCAGHGTVDELEVADSQLTVVGDTGALVELVLGPFEKRR